MEESLHGGRPPSLRRRLLVLVTVATLLAWVVAAVFIYRQARHDVQELMDGQMAETAKVLLAHAAITPSPTELPLDLGGLRGLSSEHIEVAMEFQVSRADGAVLLRTTNVPAVPHGILGYADIIHAGIPWRSLALETDDGTLRIQVSHPIHARDREALEIAWNAVLPLVLSLPLLILLIYFSIRRGLRQLDDLASDVAARSPENLGTLPTEVAPLEARPLVRALNQLLRRLTTTLENERRFTADAAHELRTPLAALKIQAQIALATKDAEKQRHALDQVLAGTERATRLVEQLLRLARLDPIVKLADLQPIDLTELAQSCLADIRNTAAGKDAALGLHLTETPTMVRGDRDLLDIALRNLIENALRHTPAGTEIAVNLGLEHGEPFLAVTDNGPGVPAEELHLMVERFYRGSEAGGEGSGLGLAIVRRIAELHGALLEVESKSGEGFTARLRWCGPSSH
jgi:two-component system sensor histidine kinase QseC